MSNPLPPIATVAMRLLLDIERAVRGFSRYDKSTLGVDLRKQAMTVVRVCHRAWRDRASQAYWIEQLVWEIDEVKLSLQLGSQLRAFASFRQFEALIRVAEELGRQAGGWKRKQVPQGQNPALDAAPERAQILSTRDASACVGAKS